MTDSTTERLGTARKRILDFLGRVDRLAEPCAILGGDDLPETTVFECAAETWAGREVVHVDSSFPLDADGIRTSIQRSFLPGRILLVTLTRRAGKELFRFLEQLLVDGYVEIHDGENWRQARPPEAWRMIIHSRPGRFPMDDCVDSKLAL